MAIDVQGSHDPGGCFQPAGPVSGLLFLRSQSDCGVCPVHQCGAELPATEGLVCQLGRSPASPRKSFFKKLL